MLSSRCNEKLLDALLSLGEIFQLVSYSDHVAYALLNPAHGRATSDPGTAAGGIPRLVLSVLALLFDCRENVSKGVVLRLLQFGSAWLRHKVAASQEVATLQSDAAALNTTVHNHSLKYERGIAR